MEGEVEARKAECKTLAEDGARWKGRSQQILEKYQRIDPNEYHRLKNSVEKLSSDKSELVSQLESVRTDFETQVKEKTELVFSFFYLD